MAHLQVFADAGTLALMVCPAPAAHLCNSRQVRLPDRDGLLDALIAKADKIIKLDASPLYLEKSVSLSFDSCFATTKMRDRL